MTDLAGNNNVNIASQQTMSKPNITMITVDGTLETPERTNKRSTPESPDDLPTDSKQFTRQIIHCNSVGDLSALLPTKAPVSRKSISDNHRSPHKSRGSFKIFQVLSEKIHRIYNTNNT